MRDYANIVTAIWADARFCALPAGAQRTYLLLVTQPEISGAGTLPLTERRWARLACDTNRADIEHDLKALESAEFVYTDEDTEEVLVRTFVKHDKGYSNPKRIPVIVAAANAVRSVKLRAVLREELARLGLSDDLSKPIETSADTLFDTVTPENRVVVTVLTTDPSTHNPQSTTQDAARPTALPRSKPKRRLPPEFAVTESMMAWAREHTPLVGQRETEAFIDYWQGNGSTKADWEATWRNWMRKAQTDAERHGPNGSRASPQPKQSTTDQRVNAALQLAADLRAEANEPKGIDP